MPDGELLAQRFEEHRARLRGLAYRMLGSLAEADDAVQEAWLRLSRSEADEVESLGAWLTTVVARVCLNLLRSRRLRREDLIGVHLPDPVVSPESELQPEEAALLAESVGLAPLVVLDTLSPAERLAFVLHDTFGFPFERIAPLVGHTPVATRQLASRARRRVRGAKLPPPEADLARQREVVEAFFRAARGGDLEALVAVLDPEVVVRIDAGARHPAASMELPGSAAVARQALSGLTSLLGLPTVRMRPALVNGAAGAVFTISGRPTTVMGFTVSAGRIVEIDSIADSERVRRIAATVLAAGSPERLLAGATQSPERSPAGWIRNREALAARRG